MMMQTYLSTKVVMAKPMTRGHYEDLGVLP